jgi:hypothetical protein
MNETKPCPHCKVRTKKVQPSSRLSCCAFVSQCIAGCLQDGGCMYITCSQCKKAWCWQCGKSDHHVWECNRVR